MKELTELQQKDLQYIFHPCSQMKDYENLPPMVIKKAKGIYLEDELGNKYMDCVSSWWVNLFGHCNDRINKVIWEQINNLEHVLFVNFSHEPAIELYMDCVSSWWVNLFGHCNDRINKVIWEQINNLEHVLFVNFSHEPAIELVERLHKVVPKGIDKFLFADNGSSSIEMALKLSFQYHQQTGSKEKKKFVSLVNAYHGETIGALGVGDVDIFTSTYRPLIKEGIKAKGPDCFYCPFKKNFDCCEAECFSDMKNIIENNHKEIAAVIIEPMVQGAAGMKIYSPKYIKKLREITKKYNIHLIADEIAMGFGRTGKMFAMEHAGVSPDIMCMAKGLSAGYYPMSIIGITNEIWKNRKDVCYGTCWS